LIERDGAVSETVAVTGVAGPTGGSPAKLVGTVWFGWNIDGAIHSETRRFDGGRAAVRSATVAHALARLLDMLQAQGDPGAP
jgi:nicotinamide-nucleotide amidase